jgi:hypothetical protein
MDLNPSSITEEGKTAFSGWAELFFNGHLPDVSIAKDAQINT